MVGHPGSVCESAEVLQIRGRLVLSMLRVRREGGLSASVSGTRRARTFAPAVNVHAREIIVPNETALSAVCDVLLLVVEVPLRKTKINHVYRLVFWPVTNNTVSKLDISVQHATRVHKLQTCDLHSKWSGAVLKWKGRGIPAE